MNMNMKTNKMVLKKSQLGAVLLEALIAILIFSFGILAIAGLQGAMVKNTTDAQYRAQASYIAQQAIGRMWANPNNLSSFDGSTTIAPEVLPNAALTIETVGFTNRVNVTVTWKQPGTTTTHQFMTSASIDAN
jgi:type IV pilus assembly protein PilV